MTRTSRIETHDAGGAARSLAVRSALFAAGCGDSKEIEQRRQRRRLDRDHRADRARSDSLSHAEYEDAPEGGEFVDYAQLASAGDNTSFDPGAVQTLDESQITSALFDGLTDFDFTDTCNPVLKPLVAESFEANDDATVFTFKIKEDQKFSNGEPVLPSQLQAGLGARRLGRARLRLRLPDGLHQGWRQAARRHGRRRSTRSSPTTTP